MKKVLYLFMTVVLLAGGLGFFVKNVYALERTVSIEGVNYVSLEQMAKKYNLAIEANDGVTKLTGESVNLSISLSNNLFTINGNTFVAQEPPRMHEDTMWITAKDWAGLFNLSLTNYDKVSQMEPVYTNPVSNEAILDTKTYRVSEEWGEKIPAGVRKHGNITSIDTAHIEVPIYHIEHHNEQKQNTVQGE